MGIHLRMASFFVHACFLLLLLLVNSLSQEQYVLESVGSTTYTSNNENTQKLSEKLLFEITTHGFLLWASMGFLMPIGILTMRMLHREECGRRLRILFQIHAVSQIVAVLLATAGAVMSFKNFNNTFNNNHQRIGVALYGIIWLQALLGFLRPNRGSNGRSIWFFVHWMLGTAVSLMGVFSIYSGLQAYHDKTSRSIRIWISLFTAEMCFICFFYLFQDKWIYIQKQGVNLGNELAREKPKELSAELC
ncbi:hypothetical protein L484_026760 [Morus notabilis]|uniref:Cytochrome b561 domain-containing protein n=1 Tax=Morus notabilis TaxID=981085 RepID=W9SCY7_9ROSA|nr:cytochrome b561 domain-containing protein At2g30890 [Morus notabilis]EXC35453.1 hypothetical protein L484_026760 [Morus notabilis]